MYIDRLWPENVRNFSRGKPLEFVHTEVEFCPPKTPPLPADARLPRPRLPMDEYLQARGRRQSESHPCETSQAERPRP